MVRKKQKNKSRTQSIGFVVFLIVVVVIISSLVTILILNSVNAKPDEVSRLPYDFSVTNAVSMVLDNDIMHFGGGPNGARLERSMNITASSDALVKVSWVGDGNLVVSENEFVLRGQEPKELLFYLDIPSDLVEGAYFGEIIFEFYR